MGFGYVFIGYLTSFILYLTVDALNFGGLALLVGYTAMLFGLWQLNHYQKAFAWAKWLLIPLLITAAYDLLLSLSEMFLWNLGALSATMVGNVMEWSTFFLIILFQLALLYGIRTIAESVELKQISIKAIRNAAFVGLYAVLYVIARCLPQSQEQIQAYFSVPLVLVQIVYTVLNLLLLINCAKDICPAGEEEQPIKRSRFQIINRIGDAYERNQQRAVERTMQEAEEKMRRRQEARNKKKIHHKKKKK